MLNWVSLVLHSEVNTFWSSDICFISLLSAIPLECEWNSTRIPCCLCRESSRCCATNRVISIWLGRIAKLHTRDGNHQVIFYSINNFMQFLVIRNLAWILQCEANLEHSAIEGCLSRNNFEIIRTCKLQIVHICIAKFHTLRQSNRRIKAKLHVAQSNLRPISLKFIEVFFNLLHLVLHSVTNVEHASNIQSRLLRVCYINLLILCIELLTGLSATQICRKLALLLNWIWEACRHACGKWLRSIVRDISIRNFFVSSFRLTSSQVGREFALSSYCCCFKLLGFLFRSSLESIRNRQVYGV